MMKELQRITGRYLQYFNIKDPNLQIVLANDMYECQKNYGFTDRAKTLDEATARKNWKYVAACMKYPRSMDEPFVLIFKKPYLQRVSECELYRLVFHELTHMCDYRDYARLNHLSSYEELFKNPQTVLFQHW